MTDKTTNTTEKVIEDPNYFYIRITKNTSMTNGTEVEISSKKKEDKSKELIKIAREIINE